MQVAMLSYCWVVEDSPHGRAIRVDQYLGLVFHPHYLYSSLLIIAYRTQCPNP